MNGDGVNERFSVKDVLVEVVLPKLEAIDRKLDAKADAAIVAGIDTRVAQLERHGSPEAQECLQKLAALEVVIDGLVGWRNKLVGGYAVLSAIVVPLALYVMQTHHFI